VREEDRRFLPKNSRNSYPINTGQINEDRRGVERHTVDYLGIFQHGLTPTLVSNLSFGFQLVETREEQVSRPARVDGQLERRRQRCLIALRWSGLDDAAFDRVHRPMAGGLNDRLFGQVGLRYDNSSSFGREAKWVFLPKVGVSWVASQEPFLEGRPRQHAAVARGVGLDRPDSDARRVAHDAAVGALLRRQHCRPRAIPLNPGNPGLRFERGEEFEAGFDAGFMHDLIWCRSDVLRQDQPRPALAEAVAALERVPAGALGEHRLARQSWVRTGGTRGAGE